MKDNLINRIKSYSKDKLTDVRKYLCPKNLLAISTISLGLTFWGYDKVDGAGFDPMANLIVSGDINGRDPAIASDGNNYLVVWGNTRSIYGKQVDSNGSLVGEYITISDSTILGRRFPAVASNGVNYLIVWWDYRNGSNSSADIYGQLIGSNGFTIGNNVAVSTYINNQLYPDVASDGDNYLVVWEDDRSGNSDIYGQRVNSNGSLVGSEILISVEGDQCNITFDGTNYLVVWRASGDIHGQLVNKNGTLVGGNIAISSATNSQMNPDLVFDGNNYLVVWTDDRNGNLDIYAQLVDSSGALIGEDIAISNTTNSQADHSVTFDGNNYLVVWTDDRNGNKDIFGQLVAINGSLINADFPISTADKAQMYPATASDGIDSLVVWEDYRIDAYNIYMAMSNLRYICLQGCFGTCLDGLDNDNDGLIDWEDKKSCYTRGKFDPTKDESVGNCCDKEDNDEDSNVDGQDLDCLDEDGKYNITKNEVKLPINGSGLVGLLIGLLGATRLRNSRKREEDYFF